jgi:eukaryotic-like serine/threonine-protein kinase
VARLDQLSKLFDECLKQSPEQRTAFARMQCGEDEALLAALVDLLDRDAALEAAGHQDNAGLAGLAGLALSERLMKGKRIGPFEVDECIGTGGMGSVYRVSRIDGEVQQQAALKILKPTVADHGLFKRFSNERRLLASLNHPGICRFLDAGSLPDGQPYVLMELVEGVPLTTWCDRSGLDLRRRLELFLEVLDAVAYAHRRLVVHRDIKPSNVQVGSDGRPRLLDFGIAKQLGNENLDLTGTAERFLTPSASAPEQFLGEPAGVGCDIYALGQLLYELLCGARPFEFANLRASEVERLLLHVPAPSMTLRVQSLNQEVALARGMSSNAALARALRGDLDTIVLRCLRKRPDERYQSVEQLQDELCRVLDHRPIRARRGQRWYRVRRFMFRNRVPATLGALLGFSLLGSLAMSLVNAAYLAEERAAALIERDRAQYAVALLQQAFSAADPTRTLGAEVTARQILESARQPLVTLEAAQPELFATLAAMIAEVELDLMMEDAAGEMAERGIRAAQRSHLSEDVLRQLWSLRARSLTDQPEEDIHLAALAELERIDGARQADWLHARGRWLLLNDHRSEAGEMLAQALDASQRSDSPPRLIFDIRSDLAQAQIHAGEIDLALDTSSSTLAWLNASVGPEHPLMLLGRMRHADILRRANQLSEAAAEATEAHALIVEVFGPRSAAAGRLHVLMAAIAQQQGDFDLAIDHYRAGKEIWRESLSPDHFHHVRLGLNLASLKVHSGRDPAQAERLFRETLDTAIRQRGAESHTVQLVRALLARMVISERDQVEALAMLLGNAEAPIDVQWALPAWRQAFEQIHPSVGCAAPILSVGASHRCQELALMAKSND